MGVGVGVGLGVGGGVGAGVGVGVGVGGAGSGIGAGVVVGGTGSGCCWHPITPASGNKRTGIIMPIITNLFIYDTPFSVFSPRILA